MLLQSMLVLADPPKGEAAKAGPWWLVTVLLLCIALFFLARSMFTHLRKVRTDFPESKPRPDDPTDQGSAGED